MSGSPSIGPGGHDLNNSESTLSDDACILILEIDTVARNNFKISPYIFQFRTLPLVLV